VSIGYGRQELFFALAILRRVAGQIYLLADSLRAPKTVPDRGSGGLLTFEEP